jgi:hypothetical protein
VRELDCDRQPAQPILECSPREGEEALVRLDVDYLVKCLAKDRNTCYRVIDRPDVKNRQSPQPDYLVEDCATGRLVAVEHARFFESEEKRKHVANLVKEQDSKSDAGAAIILSISFPTPQELGKRLSDFVSKKVSKGQFSSFRHAERILLARNRWSGVRIHRFLAAEHYFKLPEPMGCDHFYLIVDRKLLEVF